jgi:predicted metal-dependent hydrolase
VRFEFPDRVPVAWNPTLPEFCAAANGVSLMMPHVEPFVIRAVRDAAGSETALRHEVERFAAQEGQHHAQHRRLNDLLEAEVPALARLERLLARSFRWLDRRSPELRAAYAAAAETSAFSLARWTEAHLRELLDGADPVISTLFLWHLAEEVEHKQVAFDAMSSLAVGPWRRLAGACLALVTLAWFTVAATVVQLVAVGRWRSPLAWWRLLRWSLGVAFTMLPDVAVSLLPSHHPSQLADPPLLRSWLRAFDPASATMPLWTATGHTPAVADQSSTEIAYSGQLSAQRRAAASSPEGTSPSPSRTA